MKKPFRIAVLASGGGTNLQSIIDQQQCGRLPVDVTLVISNNPGAGALVRAQQAGINTLCINHRNYPNREDFDRELVNALQQADIDLIVLAGFMRILTPVMLQAFPQRIINIHPALLPAFPGLDVQQQAIDYGARFSGCTVHFVDAGVDTGPIIIQAVVPILPDDSAATLAERILEQEHRIYPQAIQWLAEGRVKIEGRNVLIANTSGDKTALVNPTN
ncbi:phosphoribosylglycinamide formyltransferase [Pelovirga terrestris]|uniref:Phosphoribosylglycinamide formyltransferase n=1 Tax=Pelovirga terrestris TaxID=2771352 RepID=A0A8J6QLL1_9BACT|nr:phosphoribosylglycinamide formyltransferase [Pelovirga terrestris]